MIDTKICSSCGRTITYRKKWERNWAEVKFCSDECRRNKNRFDYREQILSLLNAKGPHQTISPDELLASEQRQDQVMLEHVRRSARLLARDGKIELIQSGKVVDPTTFKGLVRLRRK